MWNLVDPNNLPTEEVLAINNQGEVLKGEFHKEAPKFGGTIFVSSTDEDYEGKSLYLNLYNPVAYIKMSDLKKLWEDQQG